VKEGDAPSVMDKLPVKEGDATSQFQPLSQGQNVLQAAGLQPKQQLLPGIVEKNGQQYQVITVGGEKRLKPLTLAEQVSVGKLEEQRRTPEERAILDTQEANAKARIKEATDTVEAKTKTKLGILVSRGNLETVSGAINDLAGVYVDAFKEGGAGGVIQKGISKTAGFIGDLPKFLGGGEVGGKFPASGAYEGKKEETILKMMPMLTQQGLKSEGSVRIITGVLDALGTTLPELGTAPKVAKRQFRESQASFFRFARAAELLNMSFDEVFKDVDPNNIPPDRLHGWVSSVTAASSRVKIEGDEEKAFEDLVGTSISRFAEIGAGDNIAVKTLLSEEDMKFTMQKHGLTREEVLKRLE
ncbi:MAG: hypothetical protein KKE05_04295, partial [Nanoarchaeota archaeon]|nr:hypothetical protein [Nanoarchaeota archaeon]